MDKTFIYDKSLLPEPIFEGQENWIELYYKAWEIAFKNIDYVGKEGWKPQLTCMPGAGVIWQWDSCFMTFITNYSNGTLTALNNLDNLYRLRRKEDGYMSMAYSVDTDAETFPGRINPPLLAWAEWEAYLVSGDSSRFERVIPAIEGLYSFIENNRRRNCGLYWFEDSGSSGMDNSPRGEYLSPDLKGSGICHIDLACQQSLSAKCLSNMYGVLGNNEKEELYKKEQIRINELINKFHWSEKAHFYSDFFGRDNANKKVKLINSKTAATFWTLICGAATGEKAQYMVEHLFNPDEFYTKIPFATLSKDDLNYDKTGGYWLGGVWPPTNYTAARGLAAIGKSSLAREASIRFLSAMSDVNTDVAYGGIWEAYAPEDIRPSTKENGVLVRTDFVGWGGLGPIPMLIENIIGLRFNADKNTIVFDVFPNKKTGLKNMIFNGGKVSLECTDYKSFKGQSTIKISTEKPFKLCIKMNYLSSYQNIDVPAGESIFKI